MILRTIITVAFMLSLVSQLFAGGAITVENGEAKPKGSEGITVTATWTGPPGAVAWAWSLDPDNNAGATITGNGSTAIITLDYNKPGGTYGFTVMCDVTYQNDEGESIAGKPQPSPTSGTYIVVEITGLTVSPKEYCKCDTLTDSNFTITTMPSGYENSYTLTYPTDKSAGAKTAKATWSTDSKEVSFDRLAIKREGTSPENTDKLDLHEPLWNMTPSGNFVSKPHSDSKTFTLTYTAGSADRCDGIWDNKYFLTATGSDLVTSTDTSSIWTPGGALFAVVWQLTVDGNEVYTRGGGADSRSGSGGGPLSLSVGGVTLTVTPDQGATASQSVNLAADIPVDVLKASPEKSNLTHSVLASINGNSSLVIQGASSFGNNGSASLTWQDASVLPAHIKEKDCQ